MMFGSGSGAGPAEHPGGAASASEDRQQQTPVPFSGGRRPTTCSVRIVSLQYCTRMPPPQPQALVVVGS